MEIYTPYIYKIIINRNIKLNDEDIEEIVSDVFLALWNNRERLDLNKKMSSYLAGITKNLLSKKIRDLKSINYLEDLKEDLIEIDSLENQITKLEKNNLIMNEIEKLKKQDKDIFILYYYNSKSMKDISFILNIQEKKIKSRLFRIRKIIKRSLEKRGYSYNG